jgi:UDPglucose 6-dehydrogenase
MQKILIVGFGFVGQAVNHSLTADPEKAKNFSIDILDPAKGKIDLKHPQHDAIFICVPTPSNEDGSCNDKLVVDYVKRFENAFCPVIVRSTVPPSTIEKLEQINPNIVYMPEFLREKTWAEDSVSPHIIIIGCQTKKTFEKVKRLIELSSINQTHIEWVDPTEASLFKYAANTFLSMKVVYMHELYKWMMSIGKDHSWNTLASLMIDDGRFGSSHFLTPGHHGFGYSGSCFPKDTKALAFEGAGQLSLLEAVIKSNDRLRNP